MKKLCSFIGILLCIQFSILGEELYYKVISDTDLYPYSGIYFRPADFAGILKKNEVVTFINGSSGVRKNNYGDKTRKMVGYYLYNQIEYIIASNDLIPVNTERQFNHLFITDLNSQSRKTWVPEYFADVLKNDRDLLLEYEPYWLRPYYAGEGEAVSWFKVFNTDPPMYSFSFSNSIMLFYSIPFAIKNIKKAPNGYTVTVKFGISDWRMYKKDTYDWSSVENKEFFNLTFVVDGDYMDMYLEDGKEPFITFISVDLQFLAQFASRIQYDEADLSEVTFPRRGYKTAVIGETYKTTDNLRVRSKAGTDGGIITTIPKGSTVKVLEIGKKETIENSEANWVRICLPDKKEGWVFGGYLETLPE